MNYYQTIQKVIYSATVITYCATLFKPTIVLGAQRNSLALLEQNQVVSEIKSSTINNVSSTGENIAVPVKEITVPDKVVRAVITAYTSTPDQTDSTPCITADGTNLCERGTEDVLAANWLPFGTKVKIPSLYGDRVFEVHDRMNKRYGFGRMDIWLNTSKAVARQFGVKRVDVEIYYVPKTPKEIAKR